MSETRRAYPASWLIGQDYDPNEHMLNLKGKDYLQVADRLLWFVRDQRALIAAALATGPYLIQTDCVELDRERGWAHFKTTVRDVIGNAATMYGSESLKDFPDYAEKASTKALGRALAALGYGTTAAPELDEGERIVDTPVARPAAARTRNGTGATAETVRMLTPTDNPDARRVINQQAGSDALRAADKGAAAEPADKGGRDWVNLRSRMKRTLDVRTLAAADTICVAACGRNWEQTTDADYEAVYAEVARREAAVAAAARVPEDALEGISGAGGRH